MKPLSRLFLFLIALCLQAQICAAQSRRNKLVDKQTPKKVIPFIKNDSISGRDLQKAWKLDFSDEFNDTEIDTTKWNIETSIKKRIDITLFADKDQLEEKNGNIYIYYRKSGINDTAYNAGRFTSQNKYTPTYGFFECRMHVVKPNGHQTAFWMMPSLRKGMSSKEGVDGTANDGAEIDIVEATKEHAFSLGLHWDGYEKPAHKSNGRLIKAPNMHDTEFHVYGFEWTPSYLKFYFDGEVVATMTDAKLIPHVAEFIYVSGSCFGANNWVDGDIRKNEFIQNGNTDKAYIDYIRVYKSRNQ
ncbi:glycoside hydrolase family 16 protein [Lacibacter sp. H375]|uniref:glycoside hydrolase family 16 protein n=1 Tax=Lacibacter sp. H375 TaxID=3133424 RepID=UPI0030C5D612